MLLETAKLQPQLQLNHKMEEYDSQFRRLVKGFEEMESWKEEVPLQQPSLPFSDPGVLREGVPPHPPSSICREQLSLSAVEHADSIMAGLRLENMGFLLGVWKGFVLD